MAKTRTRPDARKTQTKAKPGRKKQPAPWYARHKWVPWVAVPATITIVLFALRSGEADVPAPGVAVANPVVGGDLHSLVVDPTDPDTLYIGSHQGVSLSSDGGETWEVIESLNGADAMGWAFTDDAILVGGHPGISVSSDDDDFEPRNEGLPSTDVHALGAGDEVIYAGLAGVGTFASTDGGQTWEAHSEEVGGGFMGRILVDPADDDHLVAPDMQGGAMASSDGGRSWQSLGGVQGAMWVSWDENDTDRMIVTTQGSAARAATGASRGSPSRFPRARR